MKNLPLILSAMVLVPVNLFGWNNGELLIWLDTDRGRGLEPIAKQFENDLGIKVTIDTPQNVTTSFPLAAQAAQGPDIVFWAHDKVGEWADGGLKSPYYTWGILASAGGYVFEQNGTNYDVKHVGVASPGAVAGLSKIIGLIPEGLLPKSVSYSTTEELMGQGKLAMMISGPLKSHWGSPRSNTAAIGRWVAV